MDKKSFYIRSIWSDKADDQFINDFCFACNKTFGDNSLSKSHFTRKYLNNIYGKSVLCVCYDENNRVAGARALWRNDLEGKEAYQPCDTCVLEEYRCQGLFSKMTETAINMLNSNSIIYNFPNSNSRPLYLKMGWNIYGDFKPRLWHGYNAYSFEHPEKMSDEYFDWWFVNNPAKYICINNHYYLVCAYGSFFHIVLAEIEKRTAEKMPKATFRPLLYWSTKSVFYNKSKESKIVVFKNMTDIHIPVWKIDALPKG